MPKPKYVTVRWDDTDPKSIKAAERKIARLENDGYMLFR